MARRCMIAVSEGSRTLHADLSKGFQNAVDEMKKFWEGQVEAMKPDKPDLIVIPECSDRFHHLTGETRLEYYRTRGDQMLDFWKQVAIANNAYVAYSAARELPDGTWRNSTQVIDRKGNVAGIYNKNHLVVEENTVYGMLCGKDAPIIQADFGTIGCAICFDLNFEPLRKKYEATKPDLLLFCSMFHGGLMQNYWAYSCHSHFVGSVCGDQCTIINPLGELLASTNNYKHIIAHEVNLDCKLCHYDYNWERFSAMKKKYGRGVTIFDPGHVGSVLITCERDDMTVDDMLDEFEVERLDDYMARALNHQNAHREP